MSQTSTLKGQCIAEFLGTGLLIFFGVGCVAALKVAGASFGQWEISVIWGLGVANRNLQGVPLDSDGAASYNRS